MAQPMWRSTTLYPIERVSHLLVPPHTFCNLLSVLVGHDVLRQFSETYVEFVMI